MPESDILAEFARLTAGSIREVVNNQQDLREEMHDGFADLRKEMNAGFLAIQKEFGDYREKTGRELAGLQAKAGLWGAVAGMFPVGVKLLFDSVTKSIAGGGQP